jgi:hypothetical protein
MALFLAVDLVLRVTDIVLDVGAAAYTRAASPVFDRSV